MAQMDLSSLEQKISELTSLVKQSVGEDDDESPAKEGPPETVERLEEFVNYAHRQMVPAANQWRTRSKKVAVGVLTIDYAVNAAWQTKASAVLNQTSDKKLKKDLSQLALVLVKLVDICVAFASDQDASWISASTFRLLHVVLIRMAVPLLEDSNLSIKEYASALKESSAVLANVKGAGVGVEFVREVMGALQHLLEDWKSEAGKAVISVAVGAIKSFLTWKMDDELLQGLRKGLQAGTSYFKQMHGRKRLVLLCEVSLGTVEGLNGRSLWEGALKQLRNMTTKIKHMKGNWIAEVSWVYELHRTASCALDVIAMLDAHQSEDRPGLRREAEDCLEAALHGGTWGVMGLTKVFEASRAPLTKHHGLVKTLVNGMLDGESLATVLRAALDEATGELKEGMEAGWEAKAKEIRQLFCEKGSEARRLMEEKMTEKSQIAKVQAGVAAAAEEKAKTLEKLLAKAERHVRNAVDHAKGMDPVLASIFEFRKFLFLHRLVDDEALEECVAECNAIWQRFGSHCRDQLGSGAESEGERERAVEAAFEESLAGMSDQVRAVVSDSILTDNLGQTIADLSPAILDQAIALLRDGLAPLLQDSALSGSSLPSLSSPLSFYELVAELGDKEEARLRADKVLEAIHSALHAFDAVHDVLAFLRFAIALQRRLRRQDPNAIDASSSLHALVRDMDGARLALERLGFVVTSAAEAWDERRKGKGKSKEAAHNPTPLPPASETTHRQEQPHHQPRRHQDRRDHDDDDADADARRAAGRASLVRSVVWRIAASRMPCGAWASTVESLRKAQHILHAWQSQAGAEDAPVQISDKTAQRLFGQRGELQTLLLSAGSGQRMLDTLPGLQEAVDGARAKLLQAGESLPAGRRLDVGHHELISAAVAHVERAYQMSVLAGVLGNAHAEVRRLGERLERADASFQERLSLLLHDTKRSVEAMQVPHAAKLLGEGLHRAVSAFVLVKVVQRQVQSARAVMQNVANALQSAQQRAKRAQKSADAVRQWTFPRMYGFEDAKQKLQEKLAALVQDLEGLATVGELKTDNGALVTDQVRGSSVDGVLQLAGRAGGALQDALLRASELFELEDAVGRAAKHVMAEVRDKGSEMFEDMVGEVTQFAQQRLQALSTTVTSWGPSLGNLYQMFESKVSEETKGAVREIIKGVVGPPPRPELVQEAALSALLQLEPRVRGRTEEWVQKGRADSGLSDVHARMTRVFAMVRGTATAGPLKALMQQDKFRAVLRESVQTHWQEVKTEAMAAVQTRSKVQRELAGTLSRREMAPNANFLTVAEKLARCQEQQAKAGLDSLRGVQTDLQQVQAGAAGLSVELEDFVQDVTRDVKRHTIVVEIHMERLAGARADYHFNYTYNFFNHIHTNKDVTVKNELGETQTMHITRRKQRPWNIDRAPMLALVKELEDVINRQQRKRSLSVRDHFAVLRAWIADKSEAWGLMTVNPEHVPVDPSHVTPSTPLSGPKHRFEKGRAGSMSVGRASGLGSVPLDLSGDRSSGRRWEEEAAGDSGEEEEDVFGESSGVGLEQRNRLLVRKVESQREEIARLKQELQKSQRRGTTTDSLRLTGDLSSSSPTASRTRPSSAGPASRLTMTASQSNSNPKSPVSLHLSRTNGDPAGLASPVSLSRINPNAPSTPSWSRTHMSSPHR